LSDHTWQVTLYSSADGFPMNYEEPYICDSAVYTTRRADAKTAAADQGTKG